MTIILAMIISFEIILENKDNFFCQKSLWNSGAHYTCMHIILDKIWHVWLWYAVQLASAFWRKEDGIQVLAGLAPSRQTVVSLLRKRILQIWQKVSQFNKKTQLLSIKCIWWIQKFDKPSYYLCWYRVKP
jgi:hypothetical protein